MEFKFEYLFWLLFIGAIANFVWRYFRNGRSLTGAMLGGKINRELGQVEISKGTLSSQTLRVLDMESPDGERFVGISIVSKAPLAASMIPYRLSKNQAQQLIDLLQKATYMQNAA